MGKSDISRVLNVGSINWDDVWQVSKIVSPGETLAAAKRSLFMGGKGLNQSVAIARAGAQPVHLGQIGLDGGEIRNFLENESVDTQLVRVHPEKRTGRAFIQVDETGQNAIVIEGGANQALPGPAPQLLAGMEFSHPRLALLQNETSHTFEWIEFLHRDGFQVMWNPAPAPDPGGIPESVWRSIEWLVVNESEACQLGEDTNPLEAIRALSRRWRIPHILLTCGSGPVRYLTPEMGRDDWIEWPVPQVQCVDTTGAGDTFTGYLAAGLAQGLPISMAVRQAIHAASISTTRPGAANSIPYLKEIHLHMSRG